MKLIITGASGFLGKTLAQKVCDIGWDAVLVVRPGRKENLPGGAQAVELGMEHYDQLGERAGPSDCLVHLAWNGIRGRSRQNVTLQNQNVEYSVHGIKSVIDAGCGRIVLAGSHAEYGPCNGRIAEDMPCNPNTAYGAAKHLLFRETMDICRHQKVEMKELRIFSVYGPGDSAETMIMQMLQNMVKGYPCRLTKCTQMWDYLFINDAVEAIVRCCERECPDGSYNLASGEIRTLKEYVTEMAEITQTKSELLFGEIPWAEETQLSLTPDITKISKYLDWMPQISFQEGIRTIMKSVY